MQYRNHLTFPLLTSCANCQNRVVWGPPRLEPQLNKAMFIGLYPPQPTINFITSSILDRKSVSYTAYNENSVLSMAFLDHHMLTVCQLWYLCRV